MTKYRAIRTGKYASKREATRALELRLLERAGKIRELREQVRIELIPKIGQERACYWVADFIYMENGEEIWEDCKGVRTPAYVIKRKLVLQRYGKLIRES